MPRRIMKPRQMADSISLLNAAPPEKTAKIMQNKTKKINMTFGMFTDLSLKKIVTFSQDVVS